MPTVNRIERGFGGFEPIIGNFIRLDLLNPRSISRRFEILAKSPLF
jgi:hypothetical protein